MCFIASCILTHSFLICCAPMHISLEPLVHLPPTPSGCHKDLRLGECGWPEATKGLWKRCYFCDLMKFNLVFFNCISEILEIPDNWSLINSFNPFNAKDTYNFRRLKWNEDDFKKLEIRKKIVTRDPLSIFLCPKYSFAH